jgi:hypothetical protein
MFGAKAANPLENAKRSRVNKKSFFRSNPTTRAVRNGPTAATVRAKIVTRRPAFETVTWRSLAMEGSRPTMINSVVSTVNPAADRRKIGSNDASAVFFR